MIRIDIKMGSELELMFVKWEEKKGILERFLVFVFRIWWGSIMLRGGEGEMNILSEKESEYE